jgi:hypothetical protein
MCQDRHVAARMNGPDGMSLDLSIEGYEFPDLPCPVDRWDDWLLLRVRVADGARSWTHVDPSLTTWQMRGLIRWCDAIAAAGTDVPTAFEATEPNLSFLARRTGDEIHLTAVLAEETCPPWVSPDAAAPKNWAGNTAFHATFSVGPAEVQAFAAALADELARFPERTR